MSKKTLMFFIVITFISAIAYADTITKPNTFVNGTIADADEVNENFDTVYDQVNKMGGALTVDSNNRVGINDTDLKYNLHVKGNANEENGILVLERYQSGNVNGDPGIHFNDGDGTILSLISQLVTGTGTPNRLLFQNMQDGPIEFQTNSTERMRITGEGNVGIGTSTPSRLFEVGPGHVRFNGGDLEFVKTGGYNVRINLMTSHDLIFETNDEDRMIITESGNVGIGTSSPSTALHVAGTITEDSDERLKENIVPIENVLEKVSNIRGVSFDWKDKETYDSRRNIGLVAQEVEKVFPEVVYSSGDANGMKSVSYSKLTAVLVEAVKELKSENDRLKERISRLER